MSRSKLYFDIFETDTHLEYHVAAERDDVLNRQAMSRRTAKDNPRSGVLVVRWLNEAEFHNCKRIISRVPA